MPPSASGAPRQPIDGRPISHFVALDRRRSRSRSYAVCGELVDARNMSDQPTCPACVAYLEPSQSVDELFGAEKDR